MKNQKPTLHQCAMRSGTVMGIFWVFNFIVFLLGLRIPFLSLLFLGLTLYVPFAGYKLVKAYRRDYCEENLSFGQAFLFTNSLFFFATMFTAVGHYIYFRYIDRGFIFEQYSIALENLREVMGETDLQQSITQMEEALTAINTLTPIELTFQLISQNIFFGLIISLIIAPFVIRKASN